MSKPLWMYPPMPPLMEVEEIPEVEISLKDVQDLHDMYEAGGTPTMGLTLDGSIVHLDD